MPMILVYSDIKSARVKYIFQLVFTELLGLESEVTDDFSKFNDYTSTKLCYACNRIGDGLFIQRCELLNEGPIIPLEIPVVLASQHIYLFPTGAGSDLPFDIFSAIFYMVTRYEEYLPFKPDKNGRFSASSSLAWKHGFLQRPVVNEWILELRSLLLIKYPELTLLKNEFTSILTYDIDTAYAHKGKSFARNILSVFKDFIFFDYKRIREKIQVFRGLTKDPWDTYQYILDTLNKFRLNSIFFFLVGMYSAKNKNLKYSSPAMSSLIRYIANVCKIGLHPSFYTSLSFKTIQKEKLRLESISGEKISRSRQHFLKFKLPDTYLHLVKAGISEDYSMGFADSPGFRAGICSPFFFYDLKNEQITALKIFPVTCMEGNFIKYMNKTPEQSVHMISMLLDKVKSVDGLFISIWHNHTLSDRGIYKGWKSVHDRMIEKIISFQDNF